MTHASSSATDGLRALVFDVDGTLADTERDGHRVAFNHAFADCGLDWCWTPRQYGDLLAVSGSRERLAHYIDRHQPALGDWLKARDPKSKVFSVSGKDRAAITMGGAGPDGVFWYSAGAKGFATSAYYEPKGAPSWLAAFNTDGWLD